MGHRVRVSKDLPRELCELPSRSTSIPRINPYYPCLQVDQWASDEFREELVTRASTLPGVILRPTELSVPAVALVIDEALAEGQPEAFQYRREFALIREDGSIQLALIPEWGQKVLDTNWGTIHPLVRYMAGTLPPQTLIIYAPQDESEVQTVWDILQASYAYASGWMGVDRD